MSRLDKCHFPHDVYKYYLEDRYLKTTIAREKDWRTSIMSNIKAAGSPSLTSFEGNIICIQSDGSLSGATVAGSYSRFAQPNLQLEYSLEGKKLSVASVLAVSISPRLMLVAVAMEPNMHYLFIENSDYHKVSGFQCDLEIVEMASNKKGQIVMRINSNHFYLCEYNANHDAIRLNYLPLERNERPGISIDNEGNIYLAGRKGSQIWIGVYDLTGQLRRNIPSDLSEWPVDMSVSEVGEVVLLDAVHQQMVIFDHLGQLQRKRRLEFEVTGQDKIYVGQLGHICWFSAAKKCVYIYSAPLPSFVDKLTGEKC